MRAWWKSPGFWMGAVVTVFLGWVMVDSLMHQTSVHHAKPWKIQALTIQGGSLHLREISSTIGHSLPSGFGAQRTQRIDQNSGDHGIFGDWAWNEVERLDWFEFNTRLAVPLWLFLLLWVMFWFGGWAMWRRKRRQALQLPEADLLEPRSGGGEAAVERTGDEQ